ncbi:MAG: putative Transposable element Tc3 transposase [Streblomastix strix]|uniref:Putative Transposable element Tc3 transposase n=1 Tax=Streblomastix strix TaxID=222440 RepID=A0A5J4VVP3_9EUKA|nr:MAG: putative Transposable element Tc3 transposase [Streblomastix strix]
MIFAGISESMRTQSTFVDHTWTALNYQRVVKTIHDSYVRRYPGKSFYQYQDNAPIHVAKSTVAFFKSEKINVINAPARSPDPNPIESFWTKVRRAVYDAQQSFQTREELQEAVTRECPKIDADLHRSFVKSVRTRLIECIKAKSERIKY